MTALGLEPANEAGVCCGPPGGLSAVAEVSELHRLLGQEALAGRAVRQGCMHWFALCAAVGAVCGALHGWQPWVALQVMQVGLPWLHEVGPKGLLPP